jgi:hypothetical protein
MTPSIVCCCCEQMFFANQTFKFSNDKINKRKCNLPINFFEKILNNKSDYVCRSCHDDVLKGIIPKLSTSNGLKFPDLPSHIQDLSPLEERVVSPFINFMQIRPLKLFALNAQLGLKGSVVNIPIDINEMQKALPRKFIEMSTVQIKLRRHILHKSDYMFATIHPSEVCRAIQYLISTPLY